MKRLPLLLLAMLLLVLPFPAAGSTGFAIPVNSILVTTLSDTSGTCPGPTCSLRTAITVANTDGGASWITFNVTGMITLSSELPAITETTGVTTIDAESHWIDISGNDSVRLFSVGPDAALTLKNLILESGLTSGSGGIIFNQGVLTVNHCSLLNSQANYGGAIYTANASGHTGATIDVSQSYFAFNTANLYGGAIYQGSANGTITNSTFYNNTAPNGAAITNGSGWSMTITNSTIAGNNASTVGAGSLYNSSGAVTLRNTIVANPAQGANCAGIITNEGNNLDSATSCGWASALGSKSSTNPKLLPPGGNGPSTLMGLDRSSPAVDGVIYNAPNQCPAADQRGVPRPIDGNHDGIARCDIGAYELQIQVFLPLIRR